MKKVKVMSGLLSVICLVMISTSCWGAVRYLGETTWTLTIAVDDEGPATISLPITAAITHMGGAYYTMQGYMIVPGDGPFIFAGGGVLIGETLYLTMAGSQKHTDSNNLDTDVLHIELNKSTLNGTFYGVGNDFNIGSMTYGDHFAAGTLSLTGTLINLNQVSIVGAKLLLLSE